MWHLDWICTERSFPHGSASKESACHAGDLGSIPGLRISSPESLVPGEGNSYPLQYSDLENSMDCIVHGFSKGQTQLSDFHFTLLYRKQTYGHPSGKRLGKGHIRGMGLTATSYFI